jgi:raffinose/stachyose/melibiose transport system substrate-binding protein
VRLRHGVGDVRKCRGGKEESVRRTGRTVSRKDFLRLGGGGLATAALLGTAGCGGSSGDGEVISMFVGTAETAALEREAIGLVQRFEEQNPKYTVERESIPPAQVREVIQTRVRSEQPPDYFGFDTGPGFGGVLADAGLLYSLEKAYKENGWDIYDWAKQRATYNGTTYGVPDQVEELVVYYNTDLVSEEPKSLDDLQAIADELKGQGKIPFGFGDSEQWPAGHLFSIGVSNLLGREGLDDILYGGGKWDTPEVEEAINLFFREFVESGYYPDGVNAITYEDANTLFYAGKAAMNITGTWLVSEIVETVQDFEVGFFPFPSIDGSSISPPAGVGTGTFIAKEAKNPEGGIALINYYQQDETARIIMETFNTIPAHPVDTKGLDVPPLFKQVLDDLSESTEAGAFGYNIDVLTPANFNEVMFSGFQEVLNGTRSASEQAAALQNAWATAKKQGKIATQE